MNPAERALVRSQSGPGAGVPFLTSPSSPLTRIEAPLFRVLLQGRLRLPLPLSKRMWCGHSIDSFGHHRAACSRTGVLGRRGFAGESAATRVCGEAGGRVTTNVFVRNMDLGVPWAADSRRLEVVVDGLPLFGGVQLADTTLVSADEELQTVTEWPLQKPDVQRRGCTPSWLVLVPGLAAPGRNRDSHSAESSKRGGCGGTRSFSVRRPNHLLRPCWVGGAGTGLMGWRRRRMRSSATKQWLSVSEGPHSIQV